MRAQQRVLTEKQRLVARLKVIEKDRNAAMKPAAMTALKLAVLDDLWDVYGTSVIKPEAAQFVVGRMWQAFQPYSKALGILREADGIEQKLAEIAQLEDQMNRLNKTQTDRPAVNP